jgi:hypothetical protein
MCRFLIIPIKKKPGDGFRALQGILSASIKIILLEWEENTFIVVKNLLKPIGHAESFQRFVQ